jgi:hypothetical protein
VYFDGAEIGELSYVIPEDGGLDPVDVIGKVEIDAWGNHECAERTASARAIAVKREDYDVATR